MMERSMLKKSRLPILIFVLLAASMLACSINGLLGGAAGGSGGPGEVEAEQGGEVSGPDGTVLTIPPGGISQNASVEIRNVGPNESMPADSPFTPASDEYEIDLGQAEQSGPITMSLPMASKGGSLQTPPANYVVFAEPEGYLPSLVGAELESESLTFPVVGSGVYQVFAIVNADVLGSLTGIYEPLSVPSYPQKAPDWCSPTALTDLVQYHQGSWPVGGVGSEWGESSNWWLAGKASQPATTGYFFHWLLGAGGYTVPGDVKESFYNGNAEVFIWNWYGTLIPLVGAFDASDDYPGPDPNYSIVNYGFADYLYEAYKSYVQSYLWGQNGPRRPVAWGSSLAGHSRIITGSDLDNFYYNETGWGSVNSSYSWETHKNQVMNSLSTDKLEVIDTVVLDAPPRPENQRRGVLWLLPASNSSPGDILFERGPEQTLASTWYWDGTGGRENGYYFDDKLGGLESDAEFDHAFTKQTPEDQVVYNYSVLNIGKAAYDFQVEVELYQGSQLQAVQLAGESFSLNPSQKADNVTPGILGINDLAPARYTLKFILTQAGVVQDVKYVHFRIAPLPQVEVPELIEEVPPFLIFERDSFCRAGPNTIYDVVTGVEMGTEAPLTALSLESDWLQVGLFEDSLRCWVAPSSGQIRGDTTPLSSLPAPPTPTPEPADEQPPRVSIQREPSDPRLPETASIQFSASASDNVAVAKVEIYLQEEGGSAQLAKSCDDDSCSFSDTFNPGQVSYWAMAYDQAGNEAMSAVGQVTLYAVPR
jgi:hypothetical protein